MSFILDALKKLEREKERRDPEVVMVGPVPWGGRDRGHLRRKLALSAVGVAVLLAGSLWWAGSAARPGSEGALEVPSPLHTPTPAPKVVSSPAAVVDEASAAPAGTPTLDPPPRRRLDLPGAEGESAAPPSGEAPATQASSIDEGAGSMEAVATREAADEVPATTKVNRAEFRLTAISSRNGEPVALLNDRLVREGDVFDGVRVLRIGTAEVEIEVDGERRTIGF